MAMAGAGGGGAGGAGPGQEAQPYVTGLAAFGCMHAGAGKLHGALFLCSP